MPREMHKLHCDTHKLELVALGYCRREDIVLPEGRP